MPKATNICNNFLNLLYCAVNWANVADNASSSPITVIKMALATASYSVGSTMSSNETSYTNYARQDVARSAAGWTLGTRSVTNAAQVSFPQCGASGATLTSACTGKTTGASDIFHYGDLNSPITVSNLIRPVFDIGAITITEA